MHSPEYAALVRVLRAIRERSGLSQREVAARLKSQHSWIAKVETGERRVDLVEFAWICHACGADPVVEAAGLFGNWSPVHRDRPVGKTGRRK